MRPVLIPAAGDPVEVRLAKIVGLALCAVLIVVDLAVLALYDDAKASPASPSSTSYASTTTVAAIPAPTAPTTSSSTSTTSTIPPAPPTTAAPAPTPAPIAETPTEPRVVVTVSRCAEALADVEASGLTIPAGVDWYCPGPAIDEVGHYRTGLFSWSNVCQPGDHTPGIGCFIDVDEPGIRSDAYLRNVIAHELCHAIQPLDLRSVPSAAEADAVACTTEHGF